MPTDIRPGMRVRVTSGMYAGTQGRVVSLHSEPQPVGHPFQWASLDVVERLTIGVYVSALEPITETPTLRDRVAAVLEAARAQRDREAELVEAGGESAWCHEYAHLTLEEMVLALTQALEEGS